MRNTEKQIPKADQSKTGWSESTLVTLFHRWWTGSRNFGLRICAFSSGGGREHKQAHASGLRADFDLGLSTVGDSKQDLGRRGSFDVLSLIILRK
jgi:hypothetical protein